MIPAQAGADRPSAKTDSVLHEGRLLKIGTIGEKRKSRRSAGIELRRVGDLIAEILIQRCIVGFEACLPLMPAVIHANGAAEISLAKPVVLEDLDRV